jgi:hypothetical protein
VRRLSQGVVALAGHASAKPAITTQPQAAAQKAHAGQASDFQASDRPISARSRYHRRYYRYGYRPYYRPYYYARPQYYRPYPYYAPAPFTFGFGFGPYLVMMAFGVREADQAARIRSRKVLTSARSFSD